MNPAFAERALAAMGSNIIYIFGNHDKYKTRKIVENHSSVLWSGHMNSGRIEKQVIVACHYAMRVWDRSHHGSWQLYGHSHGGLPPIGKQLDIGIDNAYKLLGKYRPFSFEEVKEIMDKVKIEVVDHHGRKR